MRWIVAAALALLAACSSELDWRELKAADTGFSASLPGRAVEESRPLAGRAGVTMHQWSARGRHTVFAVGYADFPKLDERTLEEVRDTLVANIGGRIESQRPVSSGDTRGIEVDARGEHGEPLALRVRLFSRAERLYLAAILGKPGDIETGEVDTFFSAFRIVAH